MPQWTILLPGAGDFCSYASDRSVDQFADWVLNDVETRPLRGLTGWADQLKAYSEPDGSNWLMGCMKRVGYSHMIQLASSMRAGAAYVVFRDIVAKWGGLPVLSFTDVRHVRASLPLLNNSPDVLHPNLYVTHRIAALSKVYEMSNPSKWTVYDSRVVGALQTLLGRHYGSASNVPMPLRMRSPYGRSRKPHLLGLSSAGQTRIGFYAASWLQRIIAGKLTAANIALPAGADLHGAGWQAYHVEMALFVMGQ